jgi:hypothetical protein
LNPDYKIPGIPSLSETSRHYNPSSDSDFTRAQSLKALNREKP